MVAFMDDIDTQDTSSMDGHFGIGLIQKKKKIWAVPTKNSS